MAGLEENRAGSLGVASSPRKPLAVEMIDELERLSIRLSELVQRAEDRLSPVFMSEPAAPDTTDASAPEYPQLFSQARDIVERCNRHARGLENILDRVEL